MPDGGCIEFEWYPDADGDGYGDKFATAIMACGQPLSHVLDRTDCLDTPVSGASIHPGATEIIADFIDQDCNGFDRCYADLDRDNHGSMQTRDAPDLNCDQRIFQVSLTSTDCNDADEAVNPDQDDVFHDGLDADCQADDDYDQDLDGYVLPSHVGLKTYWDMAHTMEVPVTGNLPGGDCHTDNEPSANPLGTEITFGQAACDADGLDNECDGTLDAGDWDCQDQDGDGVPNGVDQVQMLDRIGGDGFFDAARIPVRILAAPWNGASLYLQGQGMPSGSYGGFGQPLLQTHEVQPTEMPDHAGHFAWVIDASVLPDGNYVLNGVSSLASDGVSAVSTTACAGWIRPDLRTYALCYEAPHTNCAGLTTTETYTRSFSSVGGCGAGHAVSFTVAGGKITAPF